MTSISLEKTLLAITAFIVGWVACPVEASSTPVLTISATQGDGTTCTVNKISSNTVNVTLRCQSKDGRTTLSGTSLKSTVGKAQTVVWGLGDITCLLGVNPMGVTAIMGSLGGVPPVSVRWACSTNIRDVTGNVTGQTTAVVGGVSWP